MSLAVLIERLTGPGPLTVTLTRRTLAAAAAVMLGLAVWTAATAWYFLFRGDITAGLLARQSAMQQGYEERIGALRAHLERPASQNLLDQDGLDKRVAELAARQGLLETRQAFLARLSDSPLPKAGLPPEPDPFARAVPSPSRTGGIHTPGKPIPVPEPIDLRLRGREPEGPLVQSQRTSRAMTIPLRDRLARIQHSLEAIEGKQMQVLDRLDRTTEARAARLRHAVREAGLDPDRLEAPLAKGGMGGPLVPATGAESNPFEAMIDRVQLGMQRLGHLDRVVATLPFGQPIAGDVDPASGFGYRIDPFTRGPAMHTGLDFRAEHGTPVRASGAGQVVAAEYAGGYGHMVEIDHGNSVATRYAHLSAITVSAGDTVAPGAVLGRAGSTGRSTGPHLHYETRIDGEAVDPQRFLRAGARLDLAQQAAR